MVTTLAASRAPQRSAPTPDVPVRDAARGGIALRRGGRIGAAHRHGRGHARRHQRRRAHPIRRAGPVPSPRAGERGEVGAGVLPDHGARRGVDVGAGGAASPATQQRASRTDRHLSDAAAGTAAAARRRLRDHRAIPPATRRRPDDRHCRCAHGRADREARAYEGAGCRLAAIGSDGPAPDGRRARGGAVLARRTDRDGARGLRAGGGGAESVAQSSAQRLVAGGAGAGRVRAAPAW